MIPPRVRDLKVMPNKGMGLEEGVEENVVIYMFLLHGVMIHNQLQSPNSYVLKDKGIISDVRIILSLCSLS